MALAQAVAGGLRPSQTITWTREDGTPEDLTGATITGKLLNLASGETRAIAGALTVTDADAGQFRWDYAAGDVVAGAYNVQFTADFGAAPSPARTFSASWDVAPAL
jgi:hypothetical protein